MSLFSRPAFYSLLNIFLLPSIFSPSNLSYAEEVVPEGINLSKQQSNVTNHLLYFPGSHGGCHHPAGALHIPLSEPFPMVCEPHSIYFSLKVSILKMC